MGGNSISSLNWVIKGGVETSRILGPVSYVLEGMQVGPVAAGALAWGCWDFENLWRSSCIIWIATA